MIVLNVSLLLLLRVFVCAAVSVVVVAVGVVFSVLPLVSHRFLSVFFNYSLLQ